MTVASASFLPGTAIPLGTVRDVAFDAFRVALLGAVARDQRLVALFAVPAGDAHRLYALLADPTAGVLTSHATVVSRHYPALTPDCPQAHWFERDIAEEADLVPDGHPWLKPIRFSAPEAQAGVTDFYRIEGSEVHEVAVGPVHAGIIEPGHFRFQAAGERVLHLEISLGYQHRGVERALRGGPDKRSVHYAETLAGDTTIGHATAYSNLVEALAGRAAPGRVDVLRAIALELERLANHVGDLGALANDIGYLPTASFCGRVRGDFLNLTASVCGSRFGRGWVRPGLSGFDIAPDQARALLAGVDRAERDARSAVSLLWTTPSVQSRFQRTGLLTAQACRDLGIVGVAARASGLPRDARVDFPTGAYRNLAVPISTWPSGDVDARAIVRRLELEVSCALVRTLIGMLGDESPAAPAAMGPLAPDHLAATIVEGWRGAICHVALTDAAGRFVRYKVFDPSFHNWAGLAYAMRGQQISDFPLCNKSFNLSYCGHDL
jgi:Ni,Fe-hydrogenase III large subunit